MWAMCQYTNAYSTQIAFALVYWHLILLDLFFYRTGNSVIRKVVYP